MVEKIKINDYYNFDEFITVKQNETDYKLGIMKSVIDNIIMIEVFNPFNVVTTY